MKKRNQLILRAIAALQDLTDANNARDLQHITGLPLERCQEILDISNDTYGLDLSDLETDDDE